MGPGSLSNNDFYNKDHRSQILGGNKDKARKPDPDGGSSGFNNYVKNNCGVSGISSSIHAS